MRLLFFVLTLCASNILIAQIDILPQDSLVGSTESVDIDSITLFAEMGQTALRNKDVLVRSAAAQNLQTQLQNFLSQPERFQLALDSLKTISVVYPQDSSFRVLSWQIYINDDLYQQYGLLQTIDNVVFELNDQSENALDPEYEALGSDNWYGALYYNVTAFETETGQPAYLLFGLDNHRYWSRRKVMDVMRLTPEGPVFDLPILVNDSAQTFRYRHIQEYSVESSSTLNFNKEENCVLFDHLTAVPARTAAGGMQFVPDGTYEGFRLKKGVWWYFHTLQNTIMNEAPRPMAKQPESGRDIMGRKQKRRN